MHLSLLLAAFDAPPTGDVDPTVGGAGTVRSRSHRSPRIRPPKPRAVAAGPGWGLALGIASSASLLVAAMGVLSLIGAIALLMLA